MRTRTRKKSYFVVPITNDRLDESKQSIRKNLNKLVEFKPNHEDIVNMISGMRPPNIEESVFEFQKLGERVKFRNREMFVWDKEKLYAETDEKLLALYEHLKKFEPLITKKENQ